MSLTKKTLSTEQVAQLLLSKNSVALFAHTNPDGDTVGASLALCLALRKIGKNAQVFCDGILGNKLNSFEATKRISKEFFGNYDLLAAIDCGDIYRTGEFSGLYDSFDETLTVDHHGGEYFSKYNCLAQSASTCQIILKIIKAMNVEIDADIATMLYLGLCTDTGNFAHSNTDAESFLAAAELLRLNADRKRVYRVFFSDTTLEETKLLAKVLPRLRMYYDNQMALLYITKTDLDEFGLDISVTAGLVRYAQNIDTVKVGVCITESANETYKVSMRGRNFPVDGICREFGGGGHTLAAGCRICGMLEDVIEKIVRTVGYTL